MQYYRLHLTFSSFLVHSIGAYTTFVYQNTNPVYTMPSTYSQQVPANHQLIGLRPILAMCV